MKARRPTIIQQVQNQILDCAILPNPGRAKLARGNRATGCPLARVSLEIVFILAD